MNCVPNEKPLQFVLKGKILRWSLVTWKESAASDVYCGPPIICFEVQSVKAFKE